MLIFDDVLRCGYELREKTLGKTINGNFEKILSIFLDGTTRTLQAIALLYDNNFYEEGYALTRILLEAVIDLQYINLNKNERAEQYLDFDKVKANELVDMLSNLNKPLVSQAKFSTKFNFKNKTRWSQLKFDEMLKAIYADQNRNVHTHLLLYKYLCSLSHPSASGLGSTTVFTKEDVLLWKKRDQLSKENLPLLSCQLTLAIYHMVNKEFSLGYFELINNINTKISQLAQKRACKRNKKSDK